jgi:type VI protein secretion system component VasK
MRALDLVQAGLEWLALLVVVLLVRAEPGPERALALTALAFLIANATIAGSLSGPFDRDQSRVIALAVIAAIAAIPSTIHRWRASRAPAD